MVLPGFVTTGLELWAALPCAASSFRQRLWGTMKMPQVCRVIRPLHRVPIRAPYPHHRFRLRVELLNAVVPKSASTPQAMVPLWLQLASCVQPLHYALMLASILLQILRRKLRIQSATHDATWCPMAVV